MKITWDKQSRYGTYKNSSKCQGIHLEESGANKEYIKLSPVNSKKNPATTFIEIPEEYVEVLCFYLQQIKKGGVENE